MKKSEIAKKLIQIVNNSDNNYDAYDDVLEHLEQSLPKQNLIKFISQCQDQWSVELMVFMIAKRI